MRRYFFFAHGFGNRVCFSWLRGTGAPRDTQNKARLRDLENCADIPDITDHTRIKKLWSWNGSLALLLAIYTKAALCLPLTACPRMQVPNKIRLFQQTANILCGGTLCYIKQVCQWTRGHLFLFRSFCSSFHWGIVLNRHIRYGRQPRIDRRKGELRPVQRSMSSCPSAFDSWT